VVGALVQQWGWRAAWLSIGGALVTALAPLAYLVVRAMPEAMGLSPDGLRRPALQQPEESAQRRD
jgi:hypothetical protein